MKKLGYTLAEVLITLAIVGVVAALTIPTFVANSRNKANASKLSTVITAVENAYTTMMAAEGVNDLTETVYFANAANGDTDKAMIELSKYLKISSSGKGDLDFTVSDGDSYCTMKNGAVLKFGHAERDLDEITANNNGYSSLGSIASLEVDVNGIDSKPNMPGRDQFVFLIGKTGTLYPAGGKIFKLLNMTSVLWNEGGCEVGKPTWFCTARLIEEGFQVNY